MGFNKPRIQRIVDVRPNDHVVHLSREGFEFFFGPWILAEQGVVEVCRTRRAGLQGFVRGARWITRDCNVAYSSRPEEIARVGQIGFYFSSALPQSFLPLI